MCKQVWSDEWSGMLFYETEGEFGEEGFKISAMELFPLDIGSQAYTEYESNDPALIKFLMANPHVRTMKKGHIHSHNNMPVFFSGTDDSELVDNCGFHNFYFSLIVNNKNEMCAKVAFKVKTEAKINTSVHFKNQKGEDKTKTFDSVKEGEAVYVYKCIIDNPQGVVEDSFKNRFQDLKSTKEKEKEAKKTTPYVSYSPGAIGFRQNGLFDTPGESGKSNEGKEVPVSKDFKNSSAYREKNQREHGAVDGRLGLVADRRVYSMLGKLLAQDHLYEGTITHILRKMDNEFYNENGLDPEQSVVSALYYDAVERKATDYYISAFPEDHNLKYFDSVMEKCISILDTYKEDYSLLVHELQECLNLEIQQ